MSDEIKVCTGCAFIGQEVVISEEVDHVVIGCPECGAPMISLDDDDARPPAPSA